MARRVSLCVVLSVLFGASTLQAAEREIVLKRAGNEASGLLSAVDSSGSRELVGSFGTATLPDGTKGVYVSWSVCATPSWPPACSDVVSGFAPPSAVTMLPGDVVEVDFDTSTMIALFTSSGPSTWKGTFRPSSEPFSYSIETNGSTQRTSVVPGWPDPSVMQVVVEKTTGTRYETTATFTGTAGGQTVAPFGLHAMLDRDAGGIIIVRMSDQ